MPRNLDSIEIVEPPIGELSKKRNGFFRTCLTSVIIIIVLLAIGILAIRMSLGPGPKILSKLPDNFPTDVPVYDRENIEVITFISGRYKNRGMEIAAFFPKIFLSPLVSRLEPTSKQEDRSKPDGTYTGLLRAVTMPVSNPHDTIQIEWRDMDTSPNFLISYYKKELEKKNFSIDTESEGKTFKQLTFSRPDGFSGSVYADWKLGDKTRTQYAILTLNTFFNLTITTSSTSTSK